MKYMQLHSTALIHGSVCSLSCAAQNQAAAAAERPFVAAMNYGGSLARTRMAEDTSSFAERGTDDRLTRTISRTEQDKTS